ncbi:MAG: hypothetical protein UU29_C0005G0047 [Candidatus Daviesbacteria bacterium GW2011_GWA2_40_9]|uniref:Stage II sporulation protein M n=1 Tax=Candidatus Daviesbacteria bacterium GW2011_GWA2_40_9 TaxID=1618424 RepID=A0A0G0U872_9BACT|nr:MAG: hypothetical protein UU29_C0005G0047 [Candidatus Daviesbacteria bacterium GW2011_GWA2_40_9]
MFLTKSNFFKELKISFQVFGVGVVLGIILASVAKMNAQEFFRNLLEANQDIFQAAQTGNYFELTFSIFKQNLTTAFIIVALGVLHRYLSLAIIFFNGILLGIVILLASELGLSVPKILQMLLPHGVFEIPALLLAGALAIKLSHPGRGFSDRFKTLLKSTSAL